MGGLIDRTFAAAGGLLFLQAPAYMQQYTLRLSGHLAELKLQIDTMRQAAQLSGKTLPQFIQKFLSSGDSDFARQGDLMQGMLDRYYDMQNASIALQSTTVYDKPFVFLSHLNWDIAKDALHSFHFEISLTFEALVYAIIGIGLGCLLFRLIKRVLKAFCYPFQKKVVTSERS